MARGSTLKVQDPVGDRVDAAVREILANYREVAVVGCSATPGKPAHDVPAFMQSEGWRIVPVNPFHDEVLGERAYPTVLEAPHPRFVNVFRPSAETPVVVERAVDAGAEAVWLQLGIHHPESRRIAEDAGLLYVEDACLMVEWRRGASRLRRS